MESENRRPPPRSRWRNAPGARPHSSAAPAAAARRISTGTSKSMMFQPVTTSGSRARMRRPRAASNSASLAHGVAAAGQAARARSSGHHSSTSRAPQPHNATDSSRSSGPVSMSSDSVVSAGVHCAGRSAGSSNSTVAEGAPSHPGRGRGSPSISSALRMPRSIR